MIEYNYDFTCYLLASGLILAGDLNIEEPYFLVLLCIYHESDEGHKDDEEQYVSTADVVTRERLPGLTAILERGKKLTI